MDVGRRDWECLEEVEGASFCSNIVFQALQAGHLPIHLAASFPHDSQTNIVFVLVADGIKCLLLRN